MALALLLAFAVQGSDYKPIFSDAMLEQASPEMRSRLEVLEAENRARWEADHRDSASTPGPTRSTQTPRAPVRGDGRLYRYTDATGATHYSRNPPAGVEATPVAVDERAPSAEAVAERQAAIASEQAALADFEERRRVQARLDAERDAEQSDRQKRKDECRELFNDIEDYRKGGVVYYDVNDAGEREYWSDARLRQEIVKLEGDYERHCGSLERARSQ